MNKISCEMCMDLMPLIQDGVATQDSKAAVTLHIKDCPSCASLFEGELPPPSNTTSKVIQKLKSKGVLYSTILSLLILSLILSAIMLTRYMDQKHDEQLYMKDLYHDIANCSELAEYIATVQGKPTEMYARLCYMLMDLDESLYNGYHYVSSSIQAVSGWYFVESAGDLTHSLTQYGNISPETNEIALSLHENLEYILSQMTGPDGMHLNPELDIEAFSQILFDFYRSLEPKVE